MSFVLESFVPTQTAETNIDYKMLYERTGRNYTYYSRGRHAIYHALKSLNVKGGVILPLYSCHTISDAVERAGLECVYCDISEKDLNIDFQSFIEVQKKTGAKCVIVPSLYGNPAQLDRIEAYCKENGIFLIDDSAQSFGATLDGRFLSTFGNAGLFAFSPGKATPGAMGALAWTEADYEVKRTHHDWVHRIININYNVNRKNVYTDKKPEFIKSTIQLMAALTERLMDISNDNIAEFEKRSLGGVIQAYFDGGFDYRNKYFGEFVNCFGDKGWFKIVSCQQGTPMNHKIVVLFPTREVTEQFRKHLYDNKIKTYGGYIPRKQDENCLVTQSIVGRVCEMPIENNAEKMKYLFGCVSSFFQNK